MSKRPITFNKPEDPSFLKQIKASIGYKEGPTVDTKVRHLKTRSFRLLSGDDKVSFPRDPSHRLKLIVVILFCF